MKATSTSHFRFVLVLVAALCLGTLAQAADIAVDCGAKKNNSINAALALLDKTGPHTITVSGACSEEVVIENFDDLTLRGNPGASINDPTPSVLDDNNVVTIGGSRDVTVRDLTINGGADGITCFRFSVCYLLNLTVQGGYEGISLARSEAFVGDNTVIQNTAASGISVFNGAHLRAGPYLTANGVTIQNNGSSSEGAVGVTVGNGSYADLFQVTIQGHTYGEGVIVDFGSHVRLVGSTVTGSGGTGVSVGGASVLRLQSLPGFPTTITGNGGHGVEVSYLSYLRINGARTISGNTTGPDVYCASTSAVTQGTGGSGTPNLGGGTTNCTEPAP